MSNRKQITIQFETFDEMSSLQEKDQELLKLANENLNKAYAPYSNFKVGAALITTEGATVSGANQENASFPIGACAERVAIYNLSMANKDAVLDTIAITAKSGKELLTYPVSPCGSCRQLLVEYEQKQGASIRVILRGESGAIFVFDSAKDLLPFSFNGNVFNTNL